MDGESFSLLYNAIIKGDQRATRVIILCFIVFGVLYFGISFLLDRLSANRNCRLDVKKELLLKEKNIEEELFNSVNTFRDQLIDGGIPKELRIKNLEKIRTELNANQVRCSEHFLSSMISLLDYLSVVTVISSNRDLEKEKAFFSSLRKEIRNN